MQHLDDTFGLKAMLGEANLPIHPSSFVEQDSTGAAKPDLIDSRMPGIRIGSWDQRS